MQDSGCELLRIPLPRLSEKGPSEASKAALGIVRRAKRAENGAHGGPQSRAAVASGTFRTVSEEEFSEVRCSNLPPVQGPNPLAGWG